MMRMVFVPVSRVLGSFCFLGCSALLGASGTMGCAAEYEPISGVTVSYESDGQGVITEVVAIVEKSALATFVDEERNGVAYVDFPAEVTETTFFKHIGFDYNAHGHGPPTVNDLAHLDVHFYGITQAEREAISCDAEPAPEASRVPDGVEVNAGKEPFGGCVPKMGAHGSEPYDKLTANMIYGYSQGELIFVEPMIDVEMILAEDDITLEVKHPELVGRATRLPTQFATRHSEDSYQFVLSDFTDVE